MVTKSQGKSTKKGKVKVGKLKLKKETVKNLSAADKKEVRGGLGKRNVITDPGLVFNA
jgi:hypothetical protein